MLVLTRKIGESILYELADGRVVRIKICGISGGEVEIGSDAPADINIRRGELKPLTLPRQPD